MRLDKYLKISRLIKRRTVAADACDAGRVFVNGAARKAAYDVKPGDILEISFGERSVKAEILDVSENVRKDDAGVMYKIL
ncbi:MAG: RNA-binding S4 domain-containing protein [Lachnospiraceae bacterium]|nr:RNA-binding S4 domain-containing protein [Lachnospiraceae bacterium]